jgi:hypothetical protein
MTEPALALQCADHVDQVLITITGRTSGFQEAEVPRLPEGEPIETKYGTCVVTSVEACQPANIAGKRPAGCLAP